MISGKFKGAKINLKAHQQKLQLKTKYQNKISHNQKNKTFKGELGLL